MDFAFFDSLTAAKAEDYLRQFLVQGGRDFVELAKQAASAGLVTDYSIESIAPIMLWVLPQLQTIPKLEDPTVPIWIRQTKQYQDGLFEFTESGRILVLRSAFYLGESFVRTLPQSRWAVGNEDYAEKRMPVVTGFKSELELAPILVAENLFRRVICDHSASQSIVTAIQYWISNVEV